MTTRFPSRLLSGALTLVIATTAACSSGDLDVGGDSGPDDDPGGSDGQVEAEVVVLEPDGMQLRAGGAIDAEPIDPAVALGLSSYFGNDWQRRQDLAQFEAEHSDDDLAYVAISGNTGCDSPSGAELHRDGEDLRVEWTGVDDEDVECLRAVEPSVVFAVDPGDVEGVDTIEGEPLLPADGPADLVEVLPILGAVDGLDGDDIVPDPGIGDGAWLDSPAIEQVIADLPNSDEPGADRLRQALAYKPSSGSRALAAVAHGCDGLNPPQLVVTHRQIYAQPGLDDVNVECEAPSEVVAIFELPEDAVHPSVEIDRS